jgi:hypothetical protein
LGDGRLRQRVVELGGVHEEKFGRNGS